MNQLMGELFQASKEFNRLSWVDLWNSESPIIITNPINGENAYCYCLDEGINIYFGDKGILSYLELMEMDEDHEEYEAFKNFYRQEMVRLSFEDRQDIHDDEYQLIKDSGVSFRGKKQWPVFRRFAAGQIPYLVEDTEEIKFIIIILAQLKQIFEGIMKGQYSLNDEEILKSSFQKEAWQIQQLEVDELIDHELVNPYAFNYRNDLKIHRLKKLPQAEVTLEAIQFLLPEPYLDEETGRGKFPVITALVDQDSGYLYLHDFSSHDPGNLEQLNDKIADLLLNDLEYLPEEIICSDVSLLNMIENFCEQAGIEVYTDYTEVANDFMESMLEFRGLDEVDQEFGDEAFDLSDEMVPQAVLDTVLEMGHELYGLMAEMPRLKKLPEIQKQAVLEVFIYMFVHMGVEYGETLPLWSKDSFEEFIASRVIEEELELKYQKHLHTAMINCLECAQRLELLENTNELIKIVQKYYH